MAFSHKARFSVQGKMVTFLWRAIRGILPTSTALIEKRVDIYPYCPMCAISYEDVRHSLIGCEYTNRVWNESHLPIFSIHGGSFAEWFQNAMSMLTPDVIIRIVAVLYQVWNARNTVLWEAYLRAPKQVWMAAVASLAAWTIAGQQVAAPTLQQQHVPSYAGLACFFDTTYDPNTCAASYGVVLRVEGGAFMAAMNEPLPYCENALTAEALACKEALSWLRARAVTTVTIYTDCAIVQNYISKTSSTPRSYVGIVINDCRAIMATFTYVSLFSVSRTFNFIAHSLASFASAQATMYWNLIPLDYVLPYLQ
ncbi:PREDICTED: uncharacterized protein LOC109151884 [Ipomoea nil]|uniref:uncharacterized protein LOC109151884 n=1 Tax=Ipomoea nil TaxID=35883 RepID=UPI0009011D96|nr:PREDICTED: uncharacterized protein LOC109151884 [Ipomoea nil]